MTEQPKTVRLGDLIGNDPEEEFSNFDLTEIQTILDELQRGDPIDLAHGERLQQQALRGADILIGYLGKIVKTVGYLETKVNTAKNKAALDYKGDGMNKITADMRRYAMESSPEVEAIEIKLARSKASKIVLEKKFDTIVRVFYHYKEICAGIRKTIIGYPIGSSNDEETRNKW